MTDESPEEPPRLMRISAEPNSLAELREFVRSSAAAFGASEVVASDLVQAVDEAACNTILHGYAGEPGEIEVETQRYDGKIEIRILDRSQLFDPRLATLPDVLVPPLARRPGGMGVHLLRTTMDEVHHRPREGGGNELRLVRAIDGRPNRPAEEE